METNHKIKATKQTNGFNFANILLLNIKIIIKIF